MNSHTDIVTRSTNNKTKDILYASNASLDIAYLDGPLEPVVLDEMSLDFSVISEEEILDQDQPPLVNNYLTSLVVNDDYFFYYPVNYQEISFINFAIQFMILVAFTPYLPRNGLMFMFSIDSLVNILDFIANDYLSNLSYYFYRETFAVKFIYSALVYPFILTILYLINYISVSVLFIFMRNIVSISIPNIDIFNMIELSLLFILNLPIVVNYLVNTNTFRKYYYLISNELHYLGKYLVCKKMSKAINRISKVYLHRDPKLTGGELVNFLPEISVHRLLTFCSASFIATLLFYFELDGLKFYTILVRQYYFREYLNLSKDERKKGSHRDYVFDIIEKRDWIRFTDPYTLNRLLKLYLELNRSVNGGLCRGEGEWMNRLKHISGRTITTISLASLCNFAPLSALSFYLVDTVTNVRNQISDSKDALLLAKAVGEVKGERLFCFQYYVYVFAIFMIRLTVMICYYLVAQISNEHVLLILLLELGYLMFGNIYFCKLVKDVVNIITDQFKHLKSNQFLT